MGTVASLEDLPCFLFEVNASVKKQFLLLPRSSWHVVWVLGVEQWGGCAGEAGLAWSCSSCCCTNSSVVKRKGIVSVPRENRNIPHTWTYCSWKGDQAPSRLMTLWNRKQMEGCAWCAAFQCEGICTWLQPARLSALYCCSFRTAMVMVLQLTKSYQWLLPPNRTHSLLFSFPLTRREKETS